MTAPRSWPVLLMLMLSSSVAAQTIELDRSFSVAENALNAYTVSLPDPLEVPDLASSLQSNACDLSAFPPDGVINADDIICQLWGGGDDAERHGIFSLMRVDPSTCRFVARTAFRAPGSGTIRFVGSLFDYEPTEGYFIRVEALPGQPTPVNAVTLRSRCEISLPPRVVTDGCSLSLLGLPYDSIYQTANELLCGEEGRDWSPEPGSWGAPETCTEGLYDPVTLASATVQRLQSEVGFMGRTGFWAGGAVRYLGTDFAVVPGDAVWFNPGRGYGPRVWEPESVPCP